jgi:hypothetical protein
MNGVTCMSDSLSIEHIRKAIETMNQPMQPCPHPPLFEIIEINSTRYHVCHYCLSVVKKEDIAN